MQFVCDSAASNPFRLAIAPLSPGLFLAGALTQAAAFNQDFTYNGATAPAGPAARGAVVMLFGTGFGALNAPDAAGLQWTVQPVTATIGGIPAQLSFAGGAPGCPA